MASVFVPIETTLCQLLSSFSKLRWASSRSPFVFVLSWSAFYLFLLGPLCRFQYFVVFLSFDVAKLRRILFRCKRKTLFWPFSLSFWLKSRKCVRAQWNLQGFSSVEGSLVIVAVEAVMMDLHDLFPGLDCCVVGTCRWESAEVIRLAGVVLAERI